MLEKKEIVVVNSTPMISLGSIAQLQIFRKLYGEIKIPQAVFREVMSKDDFAFQQLLDNLSWIKVEKCPDFDCNSFSKKLHDGEVEAIVLAQTINADVIVLDDNDARKTAKKLGLNLMGTIGILLRAKHFGFLDAVKPVIDTIRKNNFYLSDKILDTALKIAGETSQTEQS